MPDEPKKDRPEEIESILSDLDAILTDMGGGAPAAPKPEAPAKAPVKIEISAPQPESVKAEASKPVEPPSPPAPPPPPAPSEPARSSQIELSPREGMIKPPEKKPEPPVPAPRPAPAAAPAPASAAVGELPADTPKEQIRRVAYVYTAPCSETKKSFAAFLSQAARTISKKPLYLREVLAQEVGAASDANAVMQKALQVKACAVLAVVEGWSSAKVDEMSEACSRSNLLFRSVAPGDVQKKSTAVDIIVYMMLLPGEG